LTHTPSKLKQAKRTEGPLFKVKWKRVVADEGHVLKNAKAKSESTVTTIAIQAELLQVTQAFASLVAERRWVLTGTFVFG
jgi:SWI/SNF-related matrix-associated actin-dependent regulator of chromatin subfamily A3